MPQSDLKPENGVLKRENAEMHRDIEPDPENLPQFSVERAWGLLKQKITLLRLCMLFVAVAWWPYTKILDLVRRAL